MLFRSALTRDFWIGKTEVTQSQYEDLMGSNPSTFKGPDRPVEQVSWDDAQDFLRKLNEREHAAGRLPKAWRYRLPTEAEWEYAARAGTTTAYFFGNGAGPLDDYAWYSSNSGKQTHDVGQKQANPWGLYDIYGNVWEWCEDWHGGYSEGEQTDPSGPPSGSNRVRRGGGWIGDPQDCRSAYRAFLTPVYRRYNLGFRVLAVSAAGKGAEADGGSDVASETPERSESRTGIRP